MSEWQPIETLPRDGRYVIAFRPLAMETGDETIAIVRTLTEGKSPSISPQQVKHWTARWCHPTHWMDLPPPPGAWIITPALDAAIQDEIEHGPASIMAFTPPAHCTDKDSCHRHGECMYVGCPELAK